MASPEEIKQIVNNVIEKRFIRKTEMKILYKELDSVSVNANVAEKKLLAKLKKVFTLGSMNTAKKDIITSVFPQVFDILEKYAEIEFIEHIKNQPASFEKFIAQFNQN